MATNEQDHQTGEEYKWSGYFLGTKGHTLAGALYLIYGEQGQLGEEQLEAVIEGFQEGERDYRRWESDMELQSERQRGI